MSGPSAREMWEQVITVRSAAEARAIVVNPCFQPYDTVRDGKVGELYGMPVRCAEEFRGALKEDTACLHR